MTQAYTVQRPQVFDLPSYNICRHARCLRDAKTGTNFCQAHQPKPKLPPPAWKGKQVVYVIGVEGEPFVKIGFASNLSSRMCTLQTSSVKPMVVYCVFEGTMKLESVLHLEMQEHHVRGEWFHLEPVKKMCEALKRERYMMMRLRIENIVSEWRDAGHLWDGKRASRPS